MICISDSLIRIARALSIEQLLSQRIKAAQSNLICLSDYFRVIATKKPGEKLISGDGYYMIKAPKDYRGKKYIDGRYIYEHRYIMEKKLGRPLKYNENVDHKDGNKLNNKPKNLVLKTRAEHTRDTKPAKKS